MSKAEQLRLVTFRSKFLQHAKQSGNVSATCRYFGISREKFYKWKRRFDELGDAGLADRPTRPHRSPNATPAAVERIPGTKRRLYQFTAIDDCTRIRVLKVYEGGKIYAQKRCAARVAGGRNSIWQGSGGRGMSSCRC